MMAYSYYASISFTDHEVGRILGELDTLGFASNTAVLFHADHGWKLGALCSPVYHLRVHTSVLGLHYHTVAGVTTCVHYSLTVVNGCTAQGSMATGRNAQTGNWSADTTFLHFHIT
eukprot:COSAG06_NODE_3367_length_5442_cov_3.104810_9_plen_116_part_00